MFKMYFFPFYDAKIQRMSVTRNTLACYFEIKPLFIDANQEYVCAHNV